VIEAILVVLTNPVAGREDDFNDWYTNIHVRDAMRFRGSIATQRFIYAPEQVQNYPNGFVSKYLALYEVYDAFRFSQEHVENALTTRMVVEDSIDISRLDDYHYYPLQFRDNAPRTSASGSVVLEQINVPAEARVAFQNWYNDVYLPAVVRRPGVISGAFLVYDVYGQLVEHKPVHSHVGIYRLSTPDARAAWRGETALLRECPFIERETLAVTCWDMVASRVTEDDVHHTSAAALAAEERARARVGDRIQRDRGAHLRR
jgi:hypothetical protein